MSDNETPEDQGAASSEVGEATPAGEESAQDHEPVSKRRNASKAERPRKKTFWATLFVLVLLLLVVLAAAVGLGWITLQEKETLQQQSANLRSQLEKTQASLGQLQNAQQDIIATLNERESALKKRVLANEQRIRAQHKKLQSMSTTSREDWLLAEAEYLLRLANQRVLIERSPRSADALLVEADKILKNLEDPDLFSLRQAIASDLAQLRLVEQIDHEGVYFSLKALIEQVNSLALRPTRAEVMEEDEVATSEAETPEVAQQDAEPGMWKKLGSGIAETFSFVGDYIKFRDHSEPPPPLLPPDSAVYLQQNLRFKLERAQLALLREEQNIYQSSLREALEWLQQYYPRSAGTEAFIKQIQTLRDKTIVQELPDITYSLELLHEYIENLHQLDGVQKPQGEAP